MYGEIRDIVAGNIKRYRIKAGLTQAELAQKIGKTVERICQVENNVSTTKLVTLDQIAEALGVEPYQLLLTKEFPQYEKLSPDLVHLIAVLQKQPEDVIQSLILLFEKVNK